MQSLFLLQRINWFFNSKPISKLCANSSMAMHFRTVSTEAEVVEEVDKGVNQDEANANDEVISTDTHTAIAHTS